MSKKAIDFFIRVVILYTTVITLLYLYTALDRAELLYLCWLFISAIALKGILDFISWRKNAKNKSG